MSDEIGAIVDFLFEVGILAETPRSGFFFLGSGKQSVAEHLCRTVFIGYTLAKMDKKADAGLVMKMCLFHDLAEARTSDLNYVHQKYASANADLAVNDLAKTLPFGPDMQKTINEYQARRTRAAKLAKDADNIEWILSLKEQLDTGNTRAKTWLPSAVKRLQTKPARALARKIIKTGSDHWWFADADDEWWVSRGRK